jgi:hypothetical protein
MRGIHLRQEKGDQNKIMLRQGSRGTGRNRWSEDVHHYIRIAEDFRCGEEIFLCSLGLVGFSILSLY